MVTRETARASQRPRLLNALLELVAEKGYPAVTVAEVARRAGVSLSSFYEHFTDKQDCLLAAYDDTVEQLMSAVQVSRDVQGGIRAYLAWFHAHPHAAATFVVALHTAGPAAVQRRLEVLDGFRALLEPAAANSQHRDLLTLSVVSLLDAFVHDCLVRGDIDDLQRRSESLADVASAIMSAT
jgi:AcrR family transcriptional regulator